MLSIYLKLSLDKQYIDQQVQEKFKAAIESIKL